MKNYISNWYNAITLGMINYSAEDNHSPSQTVPGMTMSLEELLKRYVRGEMVTTVQGTYSGDSDLPDLIGLTEMDKLDMARDLKKSLHAHQYKSKVKNQSPPSVAPEPSPEPQSAL